MLAAQYGRRRRTVNETPVPTETIDPLDDRHATGVVTRTAVAAPRRRPREAGVHPRHPEAGIQGTIPSTPRQPSDSLDSRPDSRARRDSSEGVPPVRRGPRTRHAGPRARRVSQRYATQPWSSAYASPKGTFVGRRRSYIRALRVGDIGEGDGVPVREVATSSPRRVRLGLSRVGACSVPWSGPRVVHIPA